MQGPAYTLDQPMDRACCGCHDRFQHDLAFSIDHRHYCRCLVDIHPHILVPLHCRLLSGSTRSTLMWLLRVSSRQPPDKGRVLSYCDITSTEGEALSQAVYRSRVIQLRKLGTIQPGEHVFRNPSRGCWQGEHDTIT